MKAQGFCAPDSATCRPKRLLAHIALTAVTWTVLAEPLRAVNFVWNKTSGANNYNTTANWTPDSGSGVPTATDTAVFATGAGSYTVNINTSPTISSILVTIGSATFTATSANRTYSVTNSVTINNGGSLTLAGSTNVLDLIATGSLSISGAGLLTIQQGNDMSVTTVSLGTTGATSGTLLVDGLGSSLAVSGTTILGQNGGTGFLTLQNAASITLGAVSLDNSVSNNSTAILTIQSNAAATVSGNISLSNGTGFSGQSALLSVTTGTLTQTGASTTVIGGSSTGTCVANINGGGLLALGTGQVTVNKTGTVNVLAGGNFTAGGSLTNSGIITIQNGIMNVTNTLTLADSGSAAINLNGGVLSVGTLDTSTNPSRFTSRWTGGTLAITGAGGLSVFDSLGANLALAANQGLVVSNLETISGAVVQTGGSNTSANLTMAGFYTLSGTGSLVVNNNTQVAINSQRFFIQTGGTHSTTHLYLGNNSSSTGFYDLSGTGVLSATSEVLGDIGAGIFTQSGGKNSTQTLQIGGLSGGRGQYNLSGGTLNVTNSEDIGYAVTPGSNSTFNHSGGLHTIGVTSSTLTVGSSIVAGIYNLSGSGTLSVNGNEIVASSAPGTFNHTGGSNFLNGDLQIAPQPLGYTGLYNLSGAAALLTVNGSTYVGGSDTNSGGTGLLNIQAGSMTVTNALKIWNTTSTLVNLTGGILSAGTLDTSGNPSHFNWTSGTLALTGAGGLTVSPTAPVNSLAAGQTLKITNSELVGDTANGTFTQTGGTHIVNGTNFVLGNNVSSTGVYQLSGSSQLFATRETVGQSGFGTFSQTGGTNACTFALTIGGSGTGIYTLSSGSLTVDNLVIGNSGNGTFIQSGGQVSAGGIQLGNNSGATGFYRLSAGTFFAGNIFSYLGYGGNGAFIQTGGVANFADHKYLGSDFGGFGSGTYNLSAGFANFFGSLTINGITPDLLSISSGTMAIAQTFTIASFNATINLSGGLLSVGSLDTSGSPYTLFKGWSGGTFAVTGSGGLTIGPIGLSSISLNPGTKLAVSNTLQVDATGELSQNGSSVLAGILNNAGNYGALNSSIAANTLTNSAALSLIKTTFTASLASTNSGTLDAIASTLTLGTGINKLTNSGPINLIDSKVIGDITSNLSATLNTAGNVTFTGTINLSGPAILGEVQNSGLFTQTGSLTASANFTNSGTATFGGTQAWSSATTLANSGVAAFSSDAGSSSAYNLSLHLTAGTVTLNSPEHLASLVIDSAGTSFAGTVDLKSNYLLLGPGNSSTILRAYLLSGSTNDTGLKSTTATAAQGIGYADASIYNIMNPNHLFQGETLTGNETIAKLTWKGDADLSGYITMNDYAQLEAGFFFGHFNGNAGNNPASWAFGDFNYDGLVNVQDYALIDNAFHLQSGTLANDLITQHANQFGTPYTQFLNSLSTPIPEPASLALLCLSAPLLLRRRRS